MKAVRARSKHKDKLFDSMHVRRGDFQYKGTRLEADQLIERSKSQLEEGGLLYIATDEKVSCISRFFLWLLATFHFYDCANVENFFAL